MTMLRIVSLFNKKLRGLLQVASEYLRPVAYDARKLVGLMGPQTMTANEAGIGDTLQWIAAAAWH